jgi:TctA family transporter
MIEGILIGLTTALTFQNILMVMVGCFFGTIIGMLPGPWSNDCNCINDTNYLWF